MGRILRLHASFISTRKPSYNGLPMPLGQAPGKNGCGGDISTMKNLPIKMQLDQWLKP